MKITKALMPFLTYGDPTPALSLVAIEACLKAGADVIEVGVPFSDPVADGPTIQASHQRALAETPDLSVQDVIKGISPLVTKYGKPIFLMLSVNLINHMGSEVFFKQLEKGGVSGAIIPDLLMEESAEYRKWAKKTGRVIADFITPVTPPTRIQKIVAQSNGFIYLIASTGITGVRDRVDQSLKSITKTIRAVKNVPIAVGFGISTPEHVTSVLEFADGAIVGSALVAQLAQAGRSKSAIQSTMSQAIKNLKGLSPE
ncbi:tryptophan synthase subunit alpha [bacterium]|jgi:tryptophan synthase alpha chain|nr:tryptophan synthase subunit alpha [bacterium]